MQTEKPSTQQAPHASNRKFEWEKEQLYFRRMKIVWEPIWGFVWRSLVCRCIVEESSRAKDAPRLDCITPEVCPIHCHAKVKSKFSKTFSRVYGQIYTKPEDDRAYYEQYGGYDVFRLWVWCAVVDNQEIGRYINVASLMPFEEFEQKYHLFEGISDEVRSKLVEYEEEVERELKSLEELRLKLAEEGTRWSNEELDAEGTHTARSRTVVFLDQLQRRLEKGDAL